MLTEKQLLLKTNRNANQKIYHRFETKVWDSVVTAISKDISEFDVKFTCMAPKITQKSIKRKNCILFFGQCKFNID